MDIDSYIKLPSAQVIELANAKIKFWEDYKERRRKEKEQLVRDDRDWWRKRGFFWLKSGKDLTDNEIRDIILDHTGFRYYYGNTYGANINLIALAAESTDFVYLSVKDYSSIK